MKFSVSILAGLLSISSTAVGDIVAITLPKRLSVDEDFTGYLNSVGNSSKMASLDVVFGAAPIKYAREKMLGTAFLGKKTLDSRIPRRSFLFTIETPPAGATFYAIFTNRPILCY